MNHVKVHAGHSPNSSIRKRKKKKRINEKRGKKRVKMNEEQNSKLEVHSQEVHFNIYDVFH